MIAFDLPDELIAQEPARPRDHAKLLVYDRSNKEITDDYFYNLDMFLPKDATLVLNNSKVEHCRLLLEDGKREIFILEVVNDKTVRALVRPGRTFKLNTEVRLTENVTATVTDIDSDGLRTLRFSTPLDHPDIDQARHVPLPPYIKQDDTLAAEYQTVYAKTLGSKAAPTAGLHFTDDLLDVIRQIHDILEVELAVGLGTFAPLTPEQEKSGRLHAERYKIDASVGEKLQNADHIVAVGTTSVRTIESFYQNGKLEGATDIFIRPGYEFRRVDSLITNFHLQGTSLLLLVEAFVGSDTELQRIYNHAIKQKYRFYSFGDAMLIV